MQNKQKLTSKGLVCKYPSAGFFSSDAPVAAMQNSAHHAYLVTMQRIMMLVKKTCSWFSQHANNKHKRRVDTLNMNRQLDAPLRGARRRLQRQTSRY